MKEFEEMLGYLWTTLMEAKDFAYEAVENKRTMPDLAAMYFRAANSRLADVDMMSKMAETCISSAETRQEEDAEEMKLLWHVDHKRIINFVAQVKNYIEMYR